MDESSYPFDASRLIQVNPLIEAASLLHTWSLNNLRYLGLILLVFLWFYHGGAELIGPEGELVVFWNLFIAQIDG